jgi:hypothetical protein
MTSTFLDNILSYAETLNMPDGEYLSVANALKSAYDNKKDKPIWITYNCDENENISLYFDSCIGNIKNIKINIKCVSGANIKELIRANEFKILADYEITYISKTDVGKTDVGKTDVGKTDISNINNGKKDVKKGKFVWYSSGTNRLGKLHTILELAKPKMIQININDIVVEYDCYSFLREFKNRLDKDHKINCNIDSDDEDDDDYCLSDETFHNIMSNKLIDLSINWFWEKYNAETIQ